MKYVTMYNCNVLDKKAELSYQLAIKLNFHCCFSPYILPDFILDANLDAKLEDVVEVLNADCDDNKPYREISSPITHFSFKIIEVE
jgi:hypothetical protein